VGEPSKFYWVGEEWDYQEAGPETLPTAIGNYGGILVAGPAEIFYNGKTMQGHIHFESQPAVEAIRGVQQALSRIKFTR
jgi:hypothetical protein